MFVHIHVSTKPCWSYLEDRTNPSLCDDIVITVIDVRGDKVRLGFDAPKDVPIHREEVYEAIKRENEQVENQDSRP